MLFHSGEYLLFLLAEKSEYSIPLLEVVDVHDEDFFFATQYLLRLVALSRRLKIVL